MDPAARNCGGTTHRAQLQPILDIMPAMRVLFTCVDAIGHVYPMIPLARALQARGDDLLWACGADGRGRIETAGVPTVNAGVSATDRRERVAQLRDEAAGLTGEQLTAFLAPQVFGRIRASANLTDLLPNDYRPARSR
jgi:UDP:flavonoid glycosyltransferase YjiC (YdhE family)